MSPAGIIQCQSKDDIVQAVRSMPKADFATRLLQIQAIQPVLAGY